MNITSYLAFGPQLEKADEHTIKTEPMLHRATREFALANGGVLTKRFLDYLPWNDILVDSRVHMLMPGMWPCIPGWHHDDVPRTREDKQPNYETPEYRSQHCMCLWGNCSLTQFAIGEAEMEIPPVGEKIYKKWDTEVEKLCEEKVFHRMIAPEAKPIFFDWLTFHRGMPTTHKGFRFFIRATRESKLEAQNEIRYNANVYMPVIEEGW
jgi:hypothetical protein